LGIGVKNLKRYSKTFVHDLSESLSFFTSKQPVEAGSFRTGDLR
jgi:hypothetical protein